MKEVKEKTYKVNIYVQGSDKPIKMKFSEDALNNLLELYNQNKGIVSGFGYLVDITKVSYIKVISKNIY